MELKPISRIVHGPPIEPQTQQLFGGFGGVVKGVQIGPDGLVVQYESGLEVTFLPVIVASQPGVAN